MVSAPAKLPTNQPIALIDPEQIRVDAFTYQFRSKGDANGVTKKGRYNTDNWDPLLHGDPLLLHQRIDGSLFVADGHHRLDLAKRANAAGHGPGKVAAYVLREADGYTAEDVRVIAAYRNMQHGNVDAVDGARVIKEAYSGRVHQELLPQMQMDKGNLRLSVRLAGLSDMALNETVALNVPVEMAAYVADQTADAAKQEAVIQLIATKLSQDYNTRPSEYEQPVVSGQAFPVDGFVSKCGKRSQQAQTYCLTR